MDRTRWYKDAFFYQIYPRSFCDSNGDGIGDIKGITSKLDYLKELGVTAVWLSPCYKSPNDDNGYDISDYRDIMDEFGTLADWEEMVKGMHDRGIKLIMDLVVNHTSDEHKWFVESRKSKDNPYRDYYIWRKGKGKDGKKPPNNWTSRFCGKAWDYDETTGEWYMHLFSKKQPDLNWDNPKVRKEVADIVKYWLDKGCDGFRCDVITYISKEEGLPDGKWNIALVGDEHFESGPHIHEYLHELYNEGFGQYDTFTVGEGQGMSIEKALTYTAENREELDTVFTFEHMEVDTLTQLIQKPFDLRKLKAIFAKYQDGLRGKAWNTLYYENHDQPRVINRYVGKYGDKKAEAAKMLALSLYMQQGTPFVYQGQEIGMTNYPWKKWDDFDDVMVTTVRNMLKKVAPFLLPFFLHVMKWRSRDNARTPMQWNAKKNAGFTEGTPWRPVNPNYVDVNVEKEMADEKGIFNFYREMIAFRKGNRTIIEGSYKDLLPDSKELYVYSRSLNGETVVTVCNFKNKQVRVPKLGIKGVETLELHNYFDNISLSDTTTLRPYEAAVFTVKQEVR